MYNESDGKKIKKKQIKTGTDIENYVINKNIRKICYNCINNKLARIKKVDIEVKRMNRKYPSACNNKTFQRCTRLVSKV